MNKVILGDNQFCGPAALSIISGRPVDYCAKVIGDIINKPPDKVKGVFVSDMLKAFKKVRVDAVKIPHLGYSLFSCVTSMAIRQKPGVYLAVIPKHYIVLELTADKQFYICDNHTKTPISLANSARLNQKVEEVYSVSTRPPAIHIKDEVEVVKVSYIGESAYYVNIKKIYTDSEDNTSCSKGLFRANDEELKLIVSKLQGMIL